MLWFNFILSLKLILFLLFWGMVMYDNGFKPRIKSNHSIQFCILYILTHSWKWPWGGQIVVLNINTKLYSPHQYCHGAVEENDIIFLKDLCIWMTRNETARLLLGVKGLMYLTLHTSGIIFYCNYKN